MPKTKVPLLTITIYAKMDLSYSGALFRTALNL
jgi:hypothetical protein